MKKLTSALKELLMRGGVFPAHPLALDQDRNLDADSQRRLTRYYMQSGASGIAVAVHSTQFEIRDPSINLFKKVLELAAEEIDNANLDRPFLKIAGICGETAQATAEAKIAAELGYDIGLLSMASLKDWSEAAIIAHVKQIATLIPIFGFYLQPSVGGRVFSYQFWADFVAIEGVEAIKCASFNRYQTLDVMRALANSSRVNEIAMYTGNDDNIVADLLTTYEFTVNGKSVAVDFKGGLLGHWAVWTKQAVALFEEIQLAKQSNDYAMLNKLLRIGVQVTDCNAAFFDPAHDFSGCIPGIHEVLHRQGLLKGIWCLNPLEVLSEGQYDEISRVYRDYPELHDDAFVAAFLAQDQA